MEMASMPPAAGQIEVKVIEIPATHDQNEDRETIHDVHYANNLANNVQYDHVIYTIVANSLSTELDRSITMALLSQQGIEVCFSYWNRTCIIDGE